MSSYVFQGYVSSSADMDGSTGEKVALSEGFVKKYITGGFRLALEDQAKRNRRGFCMIPPGASREESTGQENRQEMPTRHHDAPENVFVQSNEDWQCMVLSFCSATHFLVDAQCAKNCMRTANIYVQQWSTKHHKSLSKSFVR